MDESLRATLGLLEKVTLSPAEIVPADIATARKAGLTDRKILDATYVCVGFNIIARIADALGFDVPSEELFARTARLLVVFGYRRLSGFWTPGLYNHTGDLMRRASSAVFKKSAFDPYDRKFRRLQKAVLSSPGSLEPAIRQTISEGQSPSGPLGAYARKVAEHAYLVTDEDIAELHRVHYTDDQIFEATVCAALGAGLLRLEYVMRALQLDQPKTIVSAETAFEETCTPSMISVT